MLKQLKLNMALKEKQSELAALLAKREEREEKIRGLEVALTEATTEDDLALVRSEMESLEEDDDAEAIAGIEGEITKIEAELAGIGEEPKEVKKEEPEEGERGVEKMNKFKTRALLNTDEYYERAEVKEFYDKVRNIRAVTGSALTVPQIIYDRIMDIVGDKTTIYPLVGIIRASGTARILIDTDTTGASWIEMSGALPAGDVGTITNIDFDGYKCGKIVFVDNYLLKDSIINLDAYVVKKLARAIGLALDIAILSGTGAAGKQPAGILPAIPAGNKITRTRAAFKLADLGAALTLVDTGDDTSGPITVAMKRSTFYERIFPLAVAADAKGSFVTISPDGTPYWLGYPIVFTQNLAADVIIVGDFMKYLLVEREDITIENSTHVKFVEDQTAFRGLGRFDGKPVQATAFAQLTLTA